MFSPGFQPPVRGHGRPLHPHLPPGTCHSCARDIQHVQTLELIANIPHWDSPVKKSKKPKRLESQCFRLGATMTLSKAWRIIKDKMESHFHYKLLVYGAAVDALPKSSTQIRFKDATEQNQRYDGPVMLPRLFAPVSSIMWEVS